jgi:hypothetical protein
VKPEKSKFAQSIKERQKNTLVPDILRNDADVNAFVLNGSPKATLLQRVGMVLFALAPLSVVFMAVQLGLGMTGNGFARLVMFMLAVPFAAWGLRILRNAIKH